MKRLMICAAIATAAVLLSASPASADHRHPRSHHRNFSVSVGVGGHGGYGSYYYGPRYRSYYSYPSYGYRYYGNPSHRYYSYPSYGYYSYPSQAYYGYYDDCGY